MQEPPGDPKCLSFRLPSIQVEVHTLRHLTTLSQLKALWHEEGTTGLCQRHSRSFSLTSHCLKRAWERLMFNGFNECGMATLQREWLKKRFAKHCETAAELHDAGQAQTCWQELWSHVWIGSGLPYIMLVLGIWYGVLGRGSSTEKSICYIDTH